jgi:hypothetical protein
MLKVKYRKDCNIHEYCKKVKRELTKSFKILENPSSFCIVIELSGVQEFDYNEIKSVQEKEYINLMSSISKDIEADKEYGHGYSFFSKIKILKFLKSLDESLSITGDYPQPTVS